MLTNLFIKMAEILAHVFNRNWEFIEEFLKNRKRNKKTNIGLKIPWFLNIGILDDFPWLLWTIIAVGILIVFGIAITIITFMLCNKKWVKIDFTILAYEEIAHSYEVSLDNISCRSSREVQSNPEYSITEFQYSANLV